jgi:hypothetical protein
MHVIAEDVAHGTAAAAAAAPVIAAEQVGWQPGAGLELLWRFFMIFLCLSNMDKFSGFLNTCKRHVDEACGLFSAWYSWRVIIVLVVSLTTSSDHHAPATPTYCTHACFVILRKSTSSVNTLCMTVESLL